MIRLDAKEQPTVLITDFELCGDLRDGGTGPTNERSASLYSSPEKLLIGAGFPLSTPCLRGLSRELIKERGDVYSLGLTAYQVCVDLLLVPQLLTF